MREYITIPLSSDYDRSDFTCGENGLNDYLHKYARQDQKRKEAAVFICIQDGVIAGYYTLSALQVNASDFPYGLVKKLRLSSYPQKPATLLGRLAVDTRFQQQKLGKHLLLDAMKRSYYQSTQIGSIAVVVDALNNNAAAFYRKFGFAPFPEHPNRLVIPMKTLSSLFNM